MTDIAYLEIGGVRFALRSRLSLEIVESDKAYSPFIRNFSEPGFTEVDMEIETSGMPDMGAMSLIIDYIFSHKSLSVERPYWMVRLSGDLRRAVTYCSKELADRAFTESVITNPFIYPLDQLVLTHILAQNNGAIIHAAGIEFEGRAYIFAGKSGAGKSTLSRQFEGYGAIFRINDDRMILRKKGEIYMAYGTPWPGEAHIAEDRMALLAGIFFIKQAKENSVTVISPADAVRRLLPAVSIPWYDRQASDMILSFCDELLSAVPLYEITFRPGPEAAELVIETAKRATRS